MAYSVNTLPDYVDQKRDELLTKAALGAETLDIIDVHLGVKHKEAVGVLSVETPFQDASICGWNPLGDDTVSNRVLEVSPIKVEKEYCWKDLLPNFMNQELRIAAGRETMPYEEVFMSENVKSVSRGLDKMIWQGDASLGFDGFVDILGDEAGTIDVSVDASAGADGLVDAVYAAIPTEILDADAHIFMSYTMYRNYIAALNATCCANRPIVDAANGSIKYAGDSRVTIKPLAGLEGFAGAIAGAAKNFVYGTDVENSENIFDLWYDKKDQKFDFRIEFVAGVQVKFPDQAVLGVIE